MAAHACENPNSRLLYLQPLEARVAQKKTQLEYIKRKVRRAARAGRIETSEQLKNAENRADSALTKMSELLHELRSADDDSWQELQPGSDAAWDDLSQAIKEIVARFS